jgi:ribonuclease HII
LFLILVAFHGRTAVAGMAVLVGIDEAGFGPILGPLVVSSCTFSLPDNLLASDLWRILTKSVSNRRKYLAGRLLVTDSKKAYSKSLGIKHLERTVLAALRCYGNEPATLRELVEVLCPDCLERLSDYPWYKDTRSYLLSPDTGDRTIAAAVLVDDLASNGIELKVLKSCCLDVAYYNKMVEAVKNKASVLFTATSQLIQAAYNNFPGDNLHIVIDRQGGRMHYRQNLQRMFPDMSLSIVRESPVVSSYDLRTDSRGMRVHFVVSADQQYLPVSLASMVSKYLREVLIGCMNRYFTGFNPDIKPTAGYWQDGLRFIEDLKTNLPHIRFSQNQLIRCR